jgi:hypothetical protein
MKKDIEYLVKQRNGYLMLANATNELIESLTPPEFKEETKSSTLRETIFTELNFKREEGPKIGVFEAAYLADNPQDKWNMAYDFLGIFGATIKNRLHNEGYQYSYWRYEGPKIYRQKLKPKTN